MSTRVSAHPDERDSATPEPRTALAEHMRAELVSAHLTHAQRVNAARIIDAITADWPEGSYRRFLRSCAAGLPDRSLTLAQVIDTADRARTLGGAA